MLENVADRNDRFSSVFVVSTSLMKMMFLRLISQADANLYRRIIYVFYAI